MYPFLYIVLIGFGLFLSSPNGFLQLFLDLLERFPVSFDCILVREERAGEIYYGEQAKHGVKPIMVGYEQEHLVGDERAERQCDGSYGRAVGPDVDRKHLAKQHDRNEPHADREHDGV